MLRILVVDDDPLHCKALSIRLEHNGFDVREAHSGDEAIHIIARVSIHVGLIDWDLGESQMTGAELGHALQRAGIATWMISGSSREAIRAKWKDPFEGWTQFYQKPISFPELMRDLRRFERQIEETKP
jgi:DNA-binding NtrC family response regulator